MVNKLQALRAKPESLEVIEGLNLDIKSMTFPETAHFAELADSKKTEDALNYLLFVTLRKAIPTKEENQDEGMTDEEIKAEVEVMDGMRAMKIVKKVQEMSGIGADSKKLEATENPPENK